MMRKRSKKKAKNRFCEQNPSCMLVWQNWAVWITGHCIFDALIIYGVSKC